MAAGLLWHGPEHGIADARSECRQEDRIKKYGWTQHDGRHYGRQVINDAAQNVNLVTEYVRLRSEEEGYWGARILVHPCRQATDGVVDREVATKGKKAQSKKSEGLSGKDQRAVFLYVAIDCDGAVSASNCLENGAEGLDILIDRRKRSGAAFIRGKTSDLGDFTLEVGVTSLTATVDIQRDISGSGADGAKDTPPDSPPALSITYWGGANVLLADLKARLVGEARPAPPKGNRQAQHNRGKSSVLSDEIPANSNVVVLRVASSGSFQIDARLRPRTPQEREKGGDDDDDEPGSEDVAEIESLLDRTTRRGLEEFKERFASVFPLSQHGYRGRNFTSEEIEAAEAAFSNLIGGVGFFHGRTPIRGQFEWEEGGSRGTRVLDSFPTSLFSAVPSRSFFPRGFLWDEGFHQLILHKWDSELTYDVFLHWLSNMHAHEKCQDLGWIPREIALGEQARRRIPAEFLPQDVAVANPPSFLLTLEDMLTLSGASADQCEVKDEDGRRSQISSMSRQSDFLEAIQDRLERWVLWLLSSQRGEKLGSFRWRGRGDPKEKLMATTFASGLDDFPRASEPGPEERHVDLLCWIIKGCQILSQLAFERAAHSLGEAEKVQQKRGKKYATVAEELLGALDDLHWNETLGGYFDYGMHSEDGYIGETYPVRCGNPTSKTVTNVRVERSILMQWDDEGGEGETKICPPDFPTPLGMLSQEATLEYFRGPEIAAQHVPRRGYVTLFPLLLGLLPADSHRIRPLLDSLKDPAQLWSPYGIRSLSASDPFYHKENAPGKSSRSAD